MTSISRFLVIIIIAVLTLITFSAAIRGYKVSMEKATTLFDNDLATLADTIGAMEHFHDTVALNNQSHIAFQIWHKNQLLSRSQNAPTKAIAAFNNEFSERNFSGKRWRVLAQFDDKKQHWVFIAQSLSDRFQVAEQLVIASMTPLIISIPILAVLVWFLVKTGLRPLNKLSKLLDKKSSDDFSEVSFKTAPTELNPVIDTLNSLLHRLGAAFQRERRFASDAAHELRTPLSVLKVSLHNLEQALKDQNLDLEQTQALDQGVERMGHVIEQILMLNRTNPESYQLRFKDVDLDDLLRQQIGDIYPRLEEKDQQIALHGGEIKVHGDAPALGILIFNLLNNCHKYIPREASIEIHTLQQDNQNILIIEDSGAGIPPKERGKVFHRFYRVGGDQHTSNQPGCGLGLAIVKQIVELHQADIQLSESETLGGLKVAIHFPTNSRFPIYNGEQSQ